MANEGIERLPRDLRADVWADLEKGLIYRGRVQTLCVWREPPSFLTRKCLFLHEPDVRSAWNARSELNVFSAGLGRR